MIGKSTTGTTAPYTLKYGFYVMIDMISEALMVDSFYVTIKTADQDMKIVLSPNLTKICYQYSLQGGISPITVIKTIDYTNLYMFDVNFTSFTSSFNWINISNPSLFALGDQYLAARNDNRTNIAANTINSSFQLAQTAYQFINTNLVYLSSRVLEGY